MAIFLCTHKLGKDPAKVFSPSQHQEFGLVSKRMGRHFYYISKLDDAWVTLRLIRDNAQQVRQDFLSGRCMEAAGVHKNKPREQVLKQIKHAEYLQRGLWPKLRKYAKGDICSSLNKLEIPIYDFTGEIIEFRTVTNSSEVFHHLLKRNSNHFAQAAETLFVKRIFGQISAPISTKQIFRIDPWWNN